MLMPYLTEIHQWVLTSRHSFLASANQRDADRTCFREQLQLIVDVIVQLRSETNRHWAGHAS